MLQLEQMLQMLQRYAHIPSETHHLVPWRDPSGMTYGAHEGFPAESRRFLSVGTQRDPSEINYPCGSHEGPSSLPTRFPCGSQVVPTLCSTHPQLPMWFPRGSLQFTHMVPLWFPGCTHIAGFRRFLSVGIQRDPSGINYPCGSHEGPSSFAHMVPLSFPGCSHIAGSPRFLSVGIQRDPSGINYPCGSHEVPMRVPRVLPT